MLYSEFSLSADVLKITVFEAAMAPMITAGVVAVENNLNPRLANLMVGVGILLSLATVKIWFHVLA